MKIIADRAALLNAVNLVSAVVPLRSPSPALSCLKLAAGKQGGVGQLKLSGTDAETSLEIVLTQVDVATPGSAVVSAEKLRQILSNLAESDPTVTIELDGDSCAIRGTSAKFKILAFPLTDYPPFPDFQAAISGGGGAQAARAVFAHPVSSFARLVARTAFATAKEVSRYAINGVLLKRDGKKLEMVATDGRRLALCRTNIKGAGGGGAGTAGEGPVQCIVPTKALTLFSKLSHNADDIARIAITDNRIFIALEDGGAPAGDGKKAAAPAAGTPRAILSSTLVEGAFPPYEDVIPKDQDKKATASRDEFAAAVRQAGVLTNEESRGIRMNFSAKGRNCKLSSRAPEMGESEIDLPLSGYEGEDVEICFNPAFFGDVLKAVDEPEVIVELKAPNKPGILRAGADFIYVLMPVNLPS